LGVTLIAANAPDHFLEDTPTAVLIDEVLAAVAPFRQAGRVAKLKGARHRNKAKTGKCGGRHSMLERDPYVAREAKRLAEEKRTCRGHASKAPDVVCDTVVQRRLAVTWPDVEPGVAAHEERLKKASSTARRRARAPWARKRSALALMAIERQERVTPCFGRWN
jgi:hypothetical protein